MNLLEFPLFFLERFSFTNEIKGTQINKHDKSITFNSCSYYQKLFNHLYLHVENYANLLDYELIWVGEVFSEVKGKYCCSWYLHNEIFHLTVYFKPCCVFVSSVLQFVAFVGFFTHPVVINKQTAPLLPRSFSAILLVSGHFICVSGQRLW